MICLEIRNRFHLTGILPQRQVMKRRNLSLPIILGTGLIIAWGKMPDENWLLFVGLLFIAMVVLLQFDDSED